MKFSILTLLLLLVLGCSSCDNPDYELEDKLYDCLKNKSIESDNINPDEIISAMESHLQKEGQLQKTNGAAYYNWIKIIVENGTSDFTIPKNIKEKINSFQLQEMSCQQLVQDTILIQGSRFFSIAKGFKESFEIISTTGDLDPELIGKNMFKVFRPEDFDHPLYKIGIYQFLLFQLEMVQQDQGVMTKLPPWSEDEPDITTLKERNVYSVLINAKNELLVRGKPMKIKDLKINTMEFIVNPNKKSDYAESPDKAIISLKNERGTKYKIYLEVLNELKAAYHELRNEKALKLYGKAFEKLNKDQQKKIRSIIPLVISEAEPTAFGEEK